jgi:hypothetical protein
MIAACAKADAGLECPSIGHRRLGTMHAESVEIYSDATNGAVMRHPGRNFPGVLLQGDTLHTLCVAADAACEEARDVMSDEGFQRLNDLRRHLRSLLNHYKMVLSEHKLRLPFSESPT